MWLNGLNAHQSLNFRGSIPVGDELLCSYLKKKERSKQQAKAKEKAVI
jgi:hypothetical protein